MWDCLSPSCLAIGGSRYADLTSIPTKFDLLERGKSYFKHISENIIADHVQKGRLRATTDFSHLREVDAILICVPTPLNAHREPDLSFVRETAGSISAHLRRGQLVVLESTAYPPAPLMN